MADCHLLFQDFNQVIRLTDSRRQALLSARDDLRSRISSGFNSIRYDMPSVIEMEYQTQGSFIMDTIINPISEDYDLDDGVYFIGSNSRANRPAPKLFHDFVIKSIFVDLISNAKIFTRIEFFKMFFDHSEAYRRQNRPSFLFKKLEFEVFFFHHSRCVFE